MYVSSTRSTIDFDDFLPENLTELESQVILLKRKGYNFKEISVKLNRHRSNIKKIFDSAINKIRETNK